LKAIEDVAAQMSSWFSNKVSEMVCKMPMLTIKRHSETLRARNTVKGRVRNHYIHYPPGNYCNISHLWKGKLSSEVPWYGIY